LNEAKEKNEGLRKQEALAAREEFPACVAPC
jgi:hypothetical protein